MKIGVIGTFIRDHIFLADQTEIKSFGGIYYTLSILGNLVTENDEIYPVCYLGQDIYDEILARLSEYKSIKSCGIKKIAQKNTAVKLVYKDVEKRDEFLTNRMPSLEFNHIQSVGPMDVWLVNFITGFEMSLDTFYKFRQQKMGFMLVDFHSLSLDIKKDGRRVLRKLSDWEQWVQGIDVLQMNEAEAASLTDFNNVSEDKLVHFGYEVIKNDIKIFHLTCGSKGSLLFYKNDNELKSQKIPAFQVEEVIDVTGCGDAFAAGFLVHVFTHKDIVAATHYANTIAGINCTIRGTEEIFKLKKFLTEGN